MGITATKRDIEVLSACPDGWFSPYDLPSSVRNPRHRCWRLLKLGKLARRVVGEYPSLAAQYNRNVDEVAPCAGLRDCRKCGTPIPMIGLHGADISPSKCHICGADDPCD